MSKQYDEYLEEHRKAVSMAAQWINNTTEIGKNLSREEFDVLMNNVFHHDDSKYSFAEYKPYDDYFYGEKDEDAFNVAWLHHIHNNPHHWQHWVLITDDGEGNEKFMALEMPKYYVIEMIADWWSFSWRSGDLGEIFQWYYEHKDRIIMHPNTLKLVESILEEIYQAVGHDNN